MFKNRRKDHPISIKEYAGQIDLLDVIEVNKMKMANDRAVVSENNFIRKAYQYDLFLQVVLTTVNGVTLMDNHDTTTNLGGAAIDESKGSAILKRNETPIANMFFKFCHRE